MVDIRRGGRGVRVVGRGGWHCLPAGYCAEYRLSLIHISQNVMSQIDNLTSGTSSSHNRIKREQLADILIPIPVSEEAKKLVAEVDRELEAAVKLIYTAESKISDKFAVLNNI